jgi:hypothetical protein
MKEDCGRAVAASVDLMIASGAWAAGSFARWSGLVGLVLRLGPQACAWGYRLLPAARAGGRGARGEPSWPAPRTRPAWTPAAQPAGRPALQKLAADVRQNAPMGGPCKMKLTG